MGEESNTQSGHSGGLGAAFHGLGSVGNRIQESAGNTKAKMAELATSGKDKVSGGYEALGGNFHSMLKDKANIDVGAMRDAGFGAIGAKWDESKKEGQKRLFDLGGPVRAKVMFGLLCATKTAATADPDMFESVRRRLGDVIEVFWNDLTIFVEEIMEDAKGATLGLMATTLDELGQFGDKPMCLSPRWWRAQVLYHLRPFDRSIFGQIRDPVFWILTVVSLISFYGIRIGFFSVVLLLIVTGCPGDEYQLVSYILGFKGTQFISSGLVQALVAAIKFYMCVLPDRTHTCDKSGPGTNQDLPSGIIDFLGSCILTWTAFCCLPCSDRNAGVREVVAVEAAGDAESNAIAEEPKKGCCGRSSADGRQRGGRMRHLLVYDFLCFVLSCMLFALLLYVDAYNLRPGEKVGQGWKHFKVWQVNSAIYWARLLYSLMSFPFFLFFIPGLQAILTHTSATGYNKNGACVPCMLKPMPSEEEKNE